MLKILLVTLITVVAIHIMVLLGLLGYGAATGRFDKEKREQYLATWRGDKLVPYEVEEETEEEKETPQEAGSRIAEAEIQRELLGRQAKRDIELMRYMQVTVDEARSKLEKDLKKVQTEQVEFESRVAEYNRKAHDEGFLKALKNYSGLKPKYVKDDFMKMNDDDVVRYLAAMKTDTAIGILNQFRTAEEQLKRLRLMKLLEEHGVIKLDETANKIDNPKATAMAR